MTTNFSDFWYHSFQNMQHFGIAKYENPTFFRTPGVQMAFSISPASGTVSFVGDGL